MIWFLRLFPQFRALEKDSDARHAMLVATCNAHEARAEHWKARHESIRELMSYWMKKCEEAETRAADAERELVDSLKTAGDSLSLRVTGRRIFSMAPVEAPPEQATSVNVSAGAGRPFARDIAARKSREMIEKLARDAGVLPRESTDKPN